MKIVMEIVVFKEVLSQFFIFILFIFKYKSYSIIFSNFAIYLSHIDVDSQSGTINQITIGDEPLSEPKGDEKPKHQGNKNRNMHEV